MVDDDGGSVPAPVNPGGASNGLLQASSPSGITLGGGGADHIPAWLKNLSKQLSDNSYPNFSASSSKSKARAAPEDGSPDSSPPRLRKKARYSTPPPPAPPSSPERDSTSNVLPPPWAMGDGAGRFSFQTSGPDPVTMLAQFQISNAAANGTSSLLGAGSSASASAWMLPPRPGRSGSGASPAFRGRGAALMNPLGFSFRRGGEDQQAGAREEEEEEEVVMTEEEGLELTLGNAETREA